MCHLCSAQEGMRHERFSWGFQHSDVEVPHCSQRGTVTVGLCTESAVQRKGEFKVWKMQIESVWILRTVACGYVDGEDGKSGNLDKFGWKSDVTSKKKARRWDDCSPWAAENARGPRKHFKLKDHVVPRRVWPQINLNWRFNGRYPTAKVIRTWKSYSTRGKTLSPFQVAISMLLKRYMMICATRLQNLVNKKVLPTLHPLISRTFNKWSEKNLLTHLWDYFKEFFAHRNPGSHCTPFWIPVFLYKCKAVSNGVFLCLVVCRGGIHSFYD